MINGTADLVGTSEDELFKLNFWKTIFSKEMYEYEGPVRGRAGLEGHKNISNVVDYVEGKNMLTGRKNAAENYGAISSISMMDDNTRDYVNGKLAWMSRESGVKYIQGLGKK